MKIKSRYQEEAIEGDEDLGPLKNLPDIWEKVNGIAVAGLS